MTAAGEHRIAITMGDPAGVGAEVIVKALARLPAETRRRHLVVGDSATLRRAIAICGLDIRLGYADDAIAVHEVAVEGLPQRFGILSDACGEAAFRYVETATRLALGGEVAGIVTAPINKQALNAAGHHYDGHTGMLAHLTGGRKTWMLLASKTLNVVHVSTHLSLRAAIDRATPERVLETVRAGHAHLVRTGLPRPRIAVAGINPHCGEGGLFGTEDDERIRPGVELARREGIDVTGPIPADTVFHRANGGAFDLVVAQYHDQGHIPIKLIAFDTAVNVTLGLPIDRVSVDHGTAFDIAGKGIAREASLVLALRRAAELAPGWGHVWRATNPGA